MPLAKLLRRPFAPPGGAPTQLVRMRGIAAAHGAVMALAPVSCGARILLLGPDADMASDTATFFGATPVRYDAPADAGAVALPLPYPDGSFDIIEACEGLDGPFLPGRAEGVDAMRPMLLAECARVLRPGGTLLLVLRVSESHPLDRCATQLGQTGLALTGLWSLQPAARAWKQMLPLEWSDAGSAGDQGGGGWRRAIRRFAPPPPSPSYLLRAVRPAHDELPKPLVDEILVRHCEGARAATLCCRPYSGSLTCAQGTSFVKVPLNPTILRQTRTVCGLFEELAQHPIAPHLPLPLRHERVGEVEYFVAAHVEHAPKGRAPDEATLTAVLRKLSVGAEAIRLDQSEFWARVFSPLLTRSLEELGATEALAYLRGLGGRIVPCGLVHGDLHLYNILNQRGALFLIDWDQFERHSPRFLDVVDLSAALIERDPLSRVRHPLLNPLRVIATGSKRVPFARLLAEEAAPLLPVERVLLYLLHRASWRCINNPRLIPRDQEHFRRSLRRCMYAVRTAR